MDDPAAVLPDHREDDCRTRFEITNGGSLVSAYAHALVGDIGSKDGCQPAEYL
jgi:hypothetical protein